MSPFRFGKTENEKIMERRAKLNKWRSEIDRAIRSYERNRDKNVENVKISMHDSNDSKARVFASNILMLDSAIRGLKDYKLFLDNLDLNLQFAKTTKDVWASLKEGSEDLLKSQISDKQLVQMSQNIEKIMLTSDQIQERLSSQLEQITTAVDSVGQKNPAKIEDILREITASPTPSKEGVPQAAGNVQSTSGKDDEIDKLIKELAKSDSEEK